MQAYLCSCNRRCRIYLSPNCCLGGLKERHSSIPLASRVLDLWRRLIARMLLNCETNGSKAAAQFLNESYSQLIDNHSRFGQLKSWGWRSVFAVYVQQTMRYVYLTRKQFESVPKLPRPTIEMTDEYDVQDAFHAILKLFFDDVRTETWTPEYAANQKRIDFVLPDFAIAIEAKHTRGSLTQSSVADQLIIDKEYYRKETSCKHLICLVYDPNLRLRSPRALEKDLSSDDSSFRVTVIVCPHGK